jgi:hypothetical protein
LFHLGVTKKKFAEYFLFSFVRNFHDALAVEGEQEEEEGEENLPFSLILIQLYANECLMERTK